MPEALARTGYRKQRSTWPSCPAVDSAGFFVALHEGLFAKQGLTITTPPPSAATEVISQQLTGKFDITGGNYVSFIRIT